MLHSIDPKALDATRQNTLAAVVNGDPGLAAALFELVSGPGGQTYRPTAVANLDRQEPYEISPQSLLVKWLRVNASVLPYPDPFGVIDALSDADRTVLGNLGVTACVPLVHEQNLVGWIGLAPAGSSADVTGQARRFMELSAEWAARLHETRQAWDAEQRADAVSRSNRLSIAGHMAATVAHEVRNPLAAARSIAQLIRDGEAPPDNRDRLLGDMIDEIDRATHLLSEILTIGKTGSWVSKVCDMSSVVSAAIDFCRPYARRRDQQFAFETDGQVSVNGDPRELRQVIVNLLLNACQARASGGEIRVSLSGAQPEQAVVLIADAGDGMPPEVLSRAFEPFYSTKADGGGLGLSICKEVVERHGGSIGIDSRVGVGTTVTICLPALVGHGTSSRR